MKSLKYYIIPLFVFIFSLNAKAQGFHVSTTKAEYNTGSSALQFSAKITLDQIEQVLGKKTDDAAFDNALENYIKSRIKVSINGALKGITFSGKQPSPNAIWVYFEVATSADVKEVDIKNSILLEKFTDQQNIVNFNVNGQRKTIICKAGAESGKASF